MRMTARLERLLLSALGLGWYFEPFFGRV
jgi:hypothetical protein